MTLYVQKAKAHLRARLWCGSMLKGRGDGDAVRSYQSTEPFYEEGDYSACQRLLILEELESGLGEWEYGAEIYFV